MINFKVLKYPFQWIKLKRKIIDQLREAKIGFGHGKSFKVPTIGVKFNFNLTQGQVMIRNSIKLNNQLLDLDLSPALGKYRVMNSYMTKDFNWVIFDFIDSSASYKTVFYDFDDFKKQNSKSSFYEFELDKLHKVPLSHFLLVAPTGFGKSATLKYWILSAALKGNKEKRYRWWFSDLKASSLAVVGKVISFEHTATTVEDTIKQLEDFNGVLKLRQKKLEKKLEIDSDADLTDEDPCIFVFDEFADYASGLKHLKKVDRDHAEHLLNECIWLGRQLNCYVWISMLKSDSSLLNTSIRSSLLFKLVLGGMSTSRETYITAFGESANVPKIKCGAGAGFYTDALTQTVVPTFVELPEFKFDLLAAYKQTLSLLRQSLHTPALYNHAGSSNYKNNGGEV